ncbi:MAG: DUF2145 domain-containing protein, partial [Proteobacteria bacterium]|nr:DUF2145 domain-containing protein [Pseudomonadota bacterium]
MKHIVRAVHALLLASMFWLPLAHAGRPCGETEPKAETVMQALELAQKTKAALEASDAQVALIARVGQDLSRYGLRYSHVAYVWRDHPQGRWMVVHELNQCGTAQSGLFNEGLGNFFMDDLFAYDTLIVIPSTATQQRIARLLADHTAAALHDAHYNMLAYAYSTRYQNSNQWLLEVLAAAYSSEPITNREQAQSWLKLAGYQPITIAIPAMTRLGGRMFRANIAFDDHPFDRRMADQIDTVTVDSVLRFVDQREKKARRIALSLQ